MSAMLVAGKHNQAQTAFSSIYVSVKYYQFTNQKISVDYMTRTVRHLFVPLLQISSYNQIAPSKQQGGATDMRSRL